MTTDRDTLRDREPHPTVLSAIDYLRGLPSRSCCCTKRRSRPALSRATGLARYAAGHCGG